MNQDSIFSRYVWTTDNTSSYPKPNVNNQRFWEFRAEPDLACVTCGKRYPSHAKGYSQLANHMDGHAKLRLPPPASAPHAHEFTDPF